MKNFRLISDNWQISQDYDGQEIIILDDRIEYRYYGQLHREDGPAIEGNNGTKQWFLNGVRHREDGPAIKWDDGAKQWYKNGMLHREDGPAVEWANGQKVWYLNGLKHREDGPAVEMPDGAEYWFLNGKPLHAPNKNAPKIINASEKFWWLFK